MLKAQGIRVLEDFGPSKGHLAFDKGAFEFLSCPAASATSLEESSRLPRGYVMQSRLLLSP